MGIIVRVIILIIAVYVASFIVPGVFFDSTQALIVSSLLIGVVNAFLKPILVILTLPLTILTLGIFYFILNGLLVLFVSNIVPGFHATSLFSAIFFSLVVSLVSAVLESFS